MYSFNQTDRPRQKKYDKYISRDEEPPFYLLTNHTVTICGAGEGV